jgi:hypothetical protein
MKRLRSVLAMAYQLSSKAGPITLQKLIRITETLMCFQGVTSHSLQLKMKLLRPVNLSGNLLLVPVLLLAVLRMMPNGHSRKCITVTVVLAWSKTLGCVGKHMLAMN